MLGVFEINSEHEFYSFTSAMKNGLQAAIQNSIDTPAPGFEMQTFAGPVFSGLRRSLGILEEEYQNSLSSDGYYLQFVSNSKSKADFFVTYDKRFFVKTQSRGEVKFLLSNLQAYVDHLEKYPHSLIVRFLGIHRIVIPNRIKTYFIVMQSVFYPDDRINIRYDIKGCEVGRWTNPATAGSQIIKVLKDNNFEGQHIALGQQQSWFVDQVKLDSDFLQGLNVLDYSLLLAHQPLHQDELDGKLSFANLVIRATKSLDLDDNPVEVDPRAFPLLEENSAQVEPDTASDQPQATGEVAHLDGIPLQEMNDHAAEASTQSELEEFHAHHRRLLPNFKNAIHVIDGPDRRYFVGIIDIFTVYGWKKRLEHLWKRLRFPGRSFSTVSPAAYSQRFCQWVQNHTQ
ncbi:phosphatidylinositol 4-phosphate 5-kinase-like protein 1 [Polymixia lowei]